MPRGSSGARVFVHADYVVKALPNSDRLVAQGRFLQRQQHNTLLPHVIQVRSDYYTMEALAELPYRLLDHNAVLVEMIDGLQTHIWSQPPESFIDHDELTQKIVRLARQSDLPEVIDTILALRQEIDWDALHRCLTHGDPTFDNVMIRPTTGDLVLIDPIPVSTTPAVPSLRSADFGHILRSCFGFEAVRYGEQFRFQVEPEDLSAYVGDRNEWRATTFWCLVHFLRVLPYMPESCYDQMRETTLKVRDFTREALCLV